MLHNNYEGAEKTVCTFPLPVLVKLGPPDDGGREESGEQE